jgi:hypothetical protein
MGQYYNPRTAINESSEPLLEPRRVSQHGVRVGSCNAGTTVPQKKEPGHAFQPVQFLRVFLLISQLAVLSSTPRIFVFVLFLGII